MRETRAIINLKHVQHNFELIQGLAPDSQLIAMVKADAYGHGMIQIARSLEPLVAGFGVCCFQEALQLRKAGIKNEIILMEGVFSPIELEEANRLSMQLAVHHQQQIDWLLESKKPFNQAIWLKINTGMNRLGFEPAIFSEVLTQLESAGHAPVLMTHMACADQRTHDLNQKQLSTFKELTATSNYKKSCLNSAGIVNFSEFAHDYIRPGLALYGIAPFERAGTPYKDLRPVMTLEAEVIARHQIRAGDQVGYGAKWIASADSTIATVSIGYGDGYPRDVPSGTNVLIGDEIFPTVGNVSMDMMAIDITQAKRKIQLGQTVCLWGENNLVESVAHSLDRIPYELVTQITARPKKIYIS